MVLELLCFSDTGLFFSISCYWAHSSFFQHWAQPICMIPSLISISNYTKSRHFWKLPCTAASGRTWATTCAVCQWVDEVWHVGQFQGRSILEHLGAVPGPPHVRAQMFWSFDVVLVAFIAIFVFMDVTAVAFTTVKLHSSQMLQLSWPPEMSDGAIDTDSCQGILLHVME